MQTLLSLDTLPLTFSTASVTAKENRINAIVGDASWVALHKSPPDSANEVSRIRTHLNFVIDRLRAAKTDHLTLEQGRCRERALGHLAQYAAAGVFPRRAPDDGFASRRPRFIDDRGVHCAVGELIRRSGDPELARAIDERWEFAFVQEIDSPELARWAESHGFDLHELAMIQPMYMPTDPVAAFVVTLVFFFILFGWMGGLFSGGVLLAWREDLGWPRLGLITAGGSLFATLVVTALSEILPWDMDLLPILGIAAVLQVGYTVVAYRLFRKR